MQKSLIRSLQTKLKNTESIFCKKITANLYFSEVVAGCVPQYLFRIQKQSMSLSFWYDEQQSMCICAKMEKQDLLQPYAPLYAPTCAKLCN